MYNNYELVCLNQWYNSAQQNTPNISKEWTNIETFFVASDWCLLLCFCCMFGRFFFSIYLVVLLQTCLSVENLLCAAVLGGVFGFLECTLKSSNWFLQVPLASLLKLCVFFAMSIADAWFSTVNFLHKKTDV